LELEDAEADWLVRTATAQPAEEIAPAAQPAREVE
jgi:hypothetical protein